MNTLPSITCNQVATFLKQNFCGNVSAVQFIGAGLFSQAFSFSTPTGRFVIRINRDDDDFKKDQYGYRNFCAPKLPIPKPVSTGQLGGQRHFCIAEQCPGRTLDALDDEVLYRLVPALFETLQALHHIDVSNTTGWGLLDAQGVGLFNSWENYLLSHFNHKFPFEWEALINNTFLERDVVNKYQQLIEELLPYLPRQKYLVHGDFGFDNVMADGSTITGVLDWAESRYGDFLYDVAYLDFWSKNVRYGDLFREQSTAQGRDIPHFEERMICYMLHIGLGSLAIDTLNNNRRGYIRIRERMRSVLKEGRRAATDWIC